ncbi:hypothetical protein GA0070216_113112 [Micromonospora matsumotoense]|uniref:Uncharacterized protein n=1 Tax=Micromonospora matsumotoense TaxID=121616 RepID=A0A1C5A4X1_9ACTN|nr:hypothetical protein [Micromonospora matsumotoense]SCF40084.1 hypothetical protein GA0070216_113112 [Micromonospora matsumotoense]
MGVDYSYPNDEAIDQTGILDKFNAGEIGGFPGKHPEGWIQAVIDEVQAEIQSNSNSMQKVDWSHYSAEEKAAYDWYTDEVIPRDKWDKIVDDYKADSAKEENVTWEKYGGTDYSGIDGKINPPDVKVYTGGDNKNGALKVSTEAIRYFANSIGALVGTDGKGNSMMLDVSNKLGELNVLPGKFARAEVMRQKISGDGSTNTGLIGDTQGLLVKVHQTLFALRESLLKMADSYEYTEDDNLRTGKDLEKKTKEFNAMTKEEFTKAMGKPWGQISDIDDYGQVGTEGGGGKSGGGESGGGKGSDGGAK